MRCGSITGVIMALSTSTAAVAQESSSKAEEGEAIFNRQCAFCHVIQDDEGQVIAGRDSGSGPNLFGVVGSAPGSRHEDYEYGDDLVAYGETGVTWGEANLVSYVQSPTAHLREALDKPGARSKMSYKLRDEQDARDVQAYLARFAAEDTTQESDTEGVGVENDA